MGRAPRLREGEASLKEIKAIKSAINKKIRGPQTLERLRGVKMALCFCRGIRIIRLTYKLQFRAQKTRQTCVAIRVR